MKMSYASIYERVCRVCLRHSAPGAAMKQLHHAGTLNEYGLGVLAFANITITPNDGLPNQICYKCLKLLKQAITFKLTCQRTHQCLQRLMKKYSKTDFKIQVIQYSMFTNYFPEENSTNEAESKIKESPSSFSVNNDLKDNSFDDFEDASNIVKPETNELLDSPDTEWFYRKMSSCLRSRRKSKSADAVDASKKCKNTLKAKIFREMIKNKFQEKRLSKSYRKSFQDQLLNTKFSSARVDKQKLPESLVCDVCNKKYASKCSLRAHVLRHEGFQFICEHCGKGFKTRAELNSHAMSLHDMPRTLACSQCDFKAKRKPELTHHMMRHTGERPYACETCGLTFRWKTVLKKHLVHHLEKKQKCDQCSRLFYHRSDLSAHMNNVHERRYLYRCNVIACHATYAKAASVRKHLRNTHGVAREQQGKILRISVQNAPTHLS